MSDQSFSVGQKSACRGIMVAVSRLSSAFQQESLRTISLLCLILFVPSCTVLMGAELESRTWTDLSGKLTVEATLESIEDKNVVLKKAGGDVVTVPIGRLSRNDQDYVEAKLYIDASTENEGDLQALIDQIGADAAAGLEGLKKLHRDNSGVTAGLILSGVLATEGGPQLLDDATKALDETLSRLRKVQKHFPSSHPKTMISALNNRAVLALRERKGSLAVTMFTQAAEIEDSVPFVVFHNVGLLLAVTSERSVLDIPPAGRRRLEQLMPTTPPDSGGVAIPERYLYSSVFNKSTPEPAGRAVPSDQRSALRMIGLWPELTCLLCSGTGFRDCPKCINGTISVKKRVHVATTSTGVAIYGTRVFPETCNLCAGRGGEKCTVCNRGRLSFDGR